MYIITAITPVFIIIILGKALQHARFFPDQFLAELNRLVYYVALPALLISRISQAPFEWKTTSSMISLFLLGTLGSLFISMGVARALKLPAEKAGSFIQGSFRGNGVFIGLPVIFYGLSALDPTAEKQASVMLAPIVIIFNLLAVLVLIRCGKIDHSTQSPTAYILRHLFQNPMIVSCIIGLIINLCNLPMPKLFLRPMDLIGSAALPLILISIGAGLDVAGLRATATPTIIASLIKVTIAPILAWLCMDLFSLSSTEKMITLIFLGVPTAGTSYVMANVLGCDAPLAGRIVALSTLLSAITLPCLIALGL
jgi:predicted permease